MGFRKGALVALSVTASAAGLISAGPAPAVELAPHRAFYTMSLNSSKLSGGVSGAQGAMTYQFSDSCDGWTVENKTALTFSYAEGGQVSTTWDFLTWESKDGMSYRFKVRSTRDGVVTEEIDGSAKLDGKDGSGTARYVRPEQKTVKLPPGTLFPTAHTAQLLQRAIAGEHIFNRLVFDGSDDTGPLEVNALIGKSLNTAATVASGPQPLVAVPAYQVNMAFYPVTGQGALPDYEVKLNYHVNGVAENVLQIFDTFSLRGKLDKVEKVAKPEC